MLTRLTAAALVTATAVATAEPARLTLTHLRGAGALACADETALKDSVVARLGYDPFVASATVRALTRVERRGAGFAATLELTIEGEAPRTRTLSSPSSDCREAIEALAFALSLAIDPQFLERGPATPPPPVTAAPPPGAPLPAVRAPEPAPAAAPSLPRLHFVTWLAVTGTAGLSPVPGVGARLAVGLRFGGFGLTAEGRADLPQRWATSGGDVDSLVALASVVPCWHFYGFGACVAVSGGAMAVDGHLAFGQKDTVPVLLVGARLLYEWMFLEHLGLRVHLEGDAVPAQITVLADQRPVFTSGRFSAEASVGLVALF